MSEIGIGECGCGGDCINHQCALCGKMNADGVKTCPECNHVFCLEMDYIGIITCPYCGKHIEG